MALRFRANIIFGFAGVPVISAVSMGFGYRGFERVSAGVASYRASVSEADLARNIDRELLTYRAAARHFIVTVQALKPLDHESHTEEESPRSAHCRNGLPQ
ncbi:hypothetical protein [Bradyrhizobium sp. USDA 3650]